MRFHVSTGLIWAVIILAAASPGANAFNPSRQCASSSSLNSNSAATSTTETSTSAASVTSTRRSFFAAAVRDVAAPVAGIAVASLSQPQPAAAKEADCFEDCFQNCKRIAPKDQQYCLDTCTDYCDQPDRRDGLSGSVNSEGGEMGILGLTTVVKGEDKPPAFKMPGLDFSKGSGKKLIGY
eukprot:CAMPEP_0185811830 /NCGR_PEP_ID=MMETSP1322-20130828/8538_1 /TAXON_ID=265543 /ORGANISM="Minutocellus polymorphus, Strain RCC2270" /LENGTH=180 /DNA_ID=CAMNT_0028508315 /DNA_START=131 /DNA_END=673 /DNA_ORIENTATION=+